MKKRCKANSKKINTQTSDATNWWKQRSSDLHCATLEEQLIAAELGFSSVARRTRSLQAHTKSSAHSYICECIWASQHRASGSVLCATMVTNNNKSVAGKWSSQMCWSGASVFVRAFDSTKRWSAKLLIQYCSRPYCDSHLNILVWQHTSAAIVESSLWVSTSSFIGVKALTIVQIVFDFNSDFSCTQMHSLAVVRLSKYRAAICGVRVQKRRQTSLAGFSFLPSICKVVVFFFVVLSVPIYCVFAFSSFRYIIFSTHFLLLHDSTSGWLIHWHRLVLDCFTWKDQPHNVAFFYFQFQASPHTAAVRTRLRDYVWICIYSR